MVPGARLHVVSMRSRLRNIIRINLPGILLASCLSISFAQDLEPTRSAGTQEAATVTDDKIYLESEVDRKAVLGSKKAFVATIEGEDMPWGCLDGKRTVQLRLVLHKSGKVTDVEVIKKSGCSEADTKAMNIARKLKFRPARKGGVAVSQYLTWGLSMRIY